MFISCARGRGGEMDLPRSLVMSSSRLAARTAPFLPVKTISVDPPEGTNLIKLSFSIVNSAFIDVSIAHNLFHGTSGAKSTDYHGSCSFLLIHLCWNVSFCSYLCFSRQLRWFGAKELIKKYFFNATVKPWKCSGNIAATLYTDEENTYLRTRCFLLHDM